MSTVLLPPAELLLVLLVLLDELLLQAGSGQGDRGHGRDRSGTSHILFLSIDLGRPGAEGSGWPVAGFIAAVSPDGLLRPGSYAGG